MSSKDPCYGCVEPERYIGCHGKCPRYLAYRKRLDLIKEKRNEDIIYIAYVRSFGRHKRSYRKARRNQRIIEEGTE